MAKRAAVRAKRAPGKRAINAVFSDGCDKKHMPAKKKKPGKKKPGKKR
jgi:hypothetical protein